MVVNSEKSCSLELDKRHAGFFEPIRHETIRIYSSISCGFTAESENKYIYLA